MDESRLRLAIREELARTLDEARLLDVRETAAKMVRSTFGPRTDVQMRKEIQNEIENAIMPILKKYDYAIMKK